MQSLAATTELDAVNIMLSTIGESPVNSLDNTGGAADVALAAQVLREITITVLSEGWQFNTEINWPLAPSVSGEIFIPDNCIEIDSCGISESVDVTQRGNRLYNRAERTFVFSGTLYCRMVIMLPFTDMPQAARNYIAVRAARVFQNRAVGSETLGGFTEKDEARTRSALKRLDTNNADHNFLTGSWSVARILTR